MVILVNSKQIIGKFFQELLAHHSLSLLVRQLKLGIDQPELKRDGQEWRCVEPN